jgi:hypothetical protein
MKRNALLLLFAVLIFSTALYAAKTLDIYVIDTEGGKAMRILTPSGCLSAALF